MGTVWRAWVHEAVQQANMGMPVGRRQGGTGTAEWSFPWIPAIDKTMAHQGTAARLAPATLGLQSAQGRSRA